MEQVPLQGKKEIVIEVTSRTLII